MRWSNVNIFEIPTGVRGRLRARATDGLAIEVTGTATSNIRFLEGILRRQFVNCVCHHQGGRRYASAWLGHDGSRLADFAPSLEEADIGTV